MCDLSASLDDGADGRIDDTVLLEYEIASTEIPVRSIWMRKRDEVGFQVY